MSFILASAKLQRAVSRVRESLAEVLGRLASCARGGVDVNGDGFKDLACQLYVQLTGFRTADVLGVLRGRTTNQVPIEGRDNARIQT